MRRGAVGRRGPGLVGTMARTAVVAGTATAVSGRVHNRQQQKYQQQEAAAYQQQAGGQEATYQQDQLEDVQAQLNELQRQQAQAAVATPAQSGGGADSALVAQLEQLAALKASGVLSDEEFQAAKAKLLAGG
jgi:hypothetical protein